MTDKLSKEEEHRKLVLEYYFKELPYKWFIRWVFNKTPVIYDPFTYKYSEYIKKGKFLYKERDRVFDVVERKPGNNVGKVKESKVVERTWKELDRRLSRISNNEDK